MVTQSTVSFAKEAKQTFGNDYSMYCGFIAQFTTGTKDGVRHSIKLLPVSFDTYSMIEV